MKKVPGTSIEPYDRSPKKGGSLGDGWRIKERKAARAADPKDHVVSASQTRPENGSEQTSLLPEHDQSTQRLRWGYSFKGLTGVSAAIAALIIAAVVLPTWLNLYGVSQQANAEIQTSSTEISGQETSAQQITPIDGYQIHLGSYQSELGARLVWAGIEADPGRLLDGLNPIFKSHQDEQGMFYHVLAGSFVHHDDAAIRCAWLEQHDVACSIIGGG